MSFSCYAPCSDYHLRGFILCFLVYLHDPLLIGRKIVKRLLGLEREEGEE